MEYNRSLFISLLEKHFGEVLFSGGRYHLKDYDNKVVAEMLDYSDKQFGNCLNPSANTSYKTVINRLLKHDQLKALESALKSVEGANKKLVQEHENLNNQWQQTQTLNKWLLGGLMGMIAIVIIGLLWLPAQLEQTIVKNQLHAEQKFIVRTPAMFENIMQFEGSLIAYTNAIRGLVLVQKIRKEKEKITPQYKEWLKKEIIHNVKEVIKETRIRFHAMGFTTVHGVNLADVLETITPHDKMYSQNAFEESIQRTMECLLNADKSLHEMAEEIIRITKSVQHKQWEQMKTVIKFEA